MECTWLVSRLLLLRVSGISCSGSQLPGRGALDCVSAVNIAQGSNSLSGLHSIFVYFICLFCFFKTQYL